MLSQGGLDAESHDGIKKTRLASDAHEGEHGEHHNSDGYPRRPAEKTKRKQCTVKDNRANHNSASPSAITSSIKSKASAMRMRPCASTLPALVALSNT